MTNIPKDPPKPVWVTTEEGGDYIPWPEWQQEFKNRGDAHKGFTYYQNRWRIHSVGFDDGSVFDNMVGWRTWDAERVPRILLVRMGLLPENPDIRWREPGECVRVPDPRGGFWAFLGLK